jgi:hypothetical protein
VEIRQEIPLITATGSGYIATRRDRTTDEPVRLIIASGRPEGESTDPLFTQGDAPGRHRYAPVEIMACPGGHLTVLHQSPRSVAEALKN